MRKYLWLTPIAIFIAMLAGCKEQAKATSDNEPHGNTIAVDFFFPVEEFSEGEAVCMRVVFRNQTRDTIALSEYPLKNLELVAVEAPPVNKVQRAPHIKPPKMWLAPGDSSFDVINLTGFYENSGPGMLAPGTYMVKTHTFFRAGAYIRNRLREYGYRDSTIITIVPPKGDAESAFKGYMEIMEPLGGVESFVGNTKIELSDEIREKLDSLAFKYPTTPIGSRILVNDLGIWYRAVPISHFAKFFEDIPANCPCCLHQHVIDRMINRYVLKEEREEQLDLVELGMKKYGPDTPLGDYIRKAYAFRIQDGFLER